MHLSKYLVKALWIAVLLAPMLVVSLGTGPQAADDPANVIKFRQKLMSSIGAHIGSIAAVVKGEVSYSAHVPAHARALHAMSQLVPDVWPEGTHEGDTRALPAIWEDKAKFDAAIKAFQTASGELAAAADSGDMAAIGAKLGDLGKSCGGCHKPFRKKKE